MRLAICLLLIASLAGAAERVCPNGIIPAQTATGASADTIKPTKTNALVIQTIRTAGTGTVIVEMSCTGGAWAKVENSDMAVDGTTTTLAKSIMFPTCLYRTNVSVCSSCNISAYYACN